MNFRFEFEPQNGLCVYRLSGQISVEGVLDGYSAARQHPGWSESYDYLSVLEHVRLGDMSPEMMGELAQRMLERDVPLPSHNRRSAIVCNDPLSHAIIAFWQRTAPQRQLTEERLFEFEDLARDWLSAARNSVSGPSRNAV